MPPAKKPAARKTTAARKPATRKPAARSSSSASSRDASTSGPTRRELERAHQRLEKLLGDAGGALQSVTKSASKTAQGAYKDLGKR